MISKAFVKQDQYVISSLSSTFHGCIITLVITLLLIKSNNRMHEYVKKKLIPKFILKDMEMYRRIYSYSATECHQTLPTNFRKSDRESNSCNDSTNAQSNHAQPPNPFVIPKSIDHLGSKYLPNQINVNLTSNLQPSKNTLPDVSV